MLYFTVGTVAFLLTMTLAGEGTAALTNPAFWLFAVGAVGGYAQFVRHIRVESEPFIEFQLLFRHPFWATNLYNLFFGATVFGFGSFLPFYAVTKYGLSAQASGAVLTPRALAMAIASFFASLFVIRLGYRAPMIVGMLFISLSMLLLGQGWTSANVFGLELDGFVIMASIVLFTGLGMGISGPAANNAALDLAPEQVAQVTGLRGMFRTLGGIVGIASVVLVLSLSADRAEALSHIFVVLSGLTLITIPLAMAIPDAARERHRQAVLEKAALKAA
jgi:MFS family permease